MAHVFIGYSREDREAAKRLAEAIEARGWTVWWDRFIPAGIVRRGRRRGNRRSEMRGGVVDASLRRLGMGTERGGGRRTQKGSDPDSSRRRSDPLGASPPANRRYFRVDRRGDRELFRIDRRDDRPRW